MYRSLVLLLITAVSSAPKGNSDITYIKQQPLAEQQSPSKPHYRESRIENLPLTIPGLPASVDIGGIKEADTDPAEEITDEDNGSSIRDKLSHNRKVDTVSKETLVTNGDDDDKEQKELENDLIKDERPKGNAKRSNPKIIHAQSKDNLSDKNFSGKPFEEDKSDITDSNLTKRSPDINPTAAQLDQGLSESEPLDTPELETLEQDANLDINEQLGIPEPYILRSEGIEASTIYDYISDTTPPVTEKNESLEQLIRETDEYEARTRAPPPRFLSKLSYFQKNADEESVVTNFIQRTGKRGFKTKCRCMTTYDCPKLQITVARCPNDNFLCC